MVAVAWRLLLSSSAVAAADPVAPQPDTPCASNLSDAMTWPPDAKMPLVCRESMASRHDPATAQRPMVELGPAMTLHGEGLRNPNVASGDWTATPQDSTSQCRAEQRAVVSPGVVGPPQVAEGQTGQPLSFQVVPRLFSIEMGGYCLWTRERRSRVYCHSAILRSLRKRDRRLGAARDGAAGRERPRIRAGDDGLPVVRALGVR